MKRIILVAMVLTAAVGVAQQNQQPNAPHYQSNLTERPQAPTYSDLYCSGFITSEKVNLENKVAAGLNTPNASLYSTGNTIYLSGPAYQEGAQFTVLRELKDPNRYEPFVGQRAAIKSLGQPYAEIGRVRVKALRGTIAVAEVEFSCQNLTVGDIVVPFQEHAPVPYRKVSTLEMFPQNPSKVAARIVMAREFDTEVGTGQKVYLSAGANQGVKAGDYFRIVRGYDLDKLSPVDATSYKAPVADDTQLVPGRVTKETTKALPVHTIGEAIVLRVTPTSATAMITNALQAVEVGDQVQLENEQ
jgi:hypothetical protein